MKLYALFIYKPISIDTNTKNDIKYGSILKNNQNNHPIKILDPIIKNLEAKYFNINLSINNIFFYMNLPKVSQPPYLFLQIPF